MRPFIAILLALFMFLSSTPIAESHHYIYFGEDPVIQMTNWPGIENGVFVRWATDATDAVYYAEPNLSTDAAMVFQNWHNAVPLPYHGTTDPSGADLSFLESQEPCGHFYWDACYEPYDFD